MMSVDACEAARFSTYVTADMKMLPCSFDVGGLKWAVDLHTTSVEDAWNSLLFEKFRDSFRNSCQIVRSVRVALWLPYYQ
jgi:hypothetical protein